MSPKARLEGDMIFINESKFWARIYFWMTLVLATGWVFFLHITGY